MENKNCITGNQFFFSVFLAKYNDGQVRADEVYGPYCTDRRVMHTQF